jgi:hypothetical protein
VAVLASGPRLRSWLTLRLAAALVVVSLAAPAQAWEVGHLAPKRQNLLKWSDAYDTATSGATWLKGANLTVTADTTAAPDGTLTADTLATGAAGSSNLQYQDLGALVQGSYCVSAQVKYVDNAWYRLILYDNGANLLRMWFNAQTCAVGTVNAAGTGSDAVGTAMIVPGGFCRASLCGTVGWATASFVLLTPHIADNNTTQPTSKTTILGGVQVNTATVRRYTRTAATARP